MKKEQRQIIKASSSLLFLFCAFLYMPIFKPLPIISYAIQYGIPTLYVILNIKHIKKIPLKTILLLLACGILTSLSLLIPIILNTNDFSYLKITTYVFRKLPIYLFLIILTIKKHGKNSVIEHYLYYYSLANMIYVLFTIAIVAVPALRHVWFHIFSATNKTEELLASYGYTFRIGWLGFSGFRFTMYCTFSCIILLYLRYSKERFISTSQFIAPFLICVLGNMFYGRTGLIATILATIILLCILNRKKIKNIILFSIVTFLSLLILYSCRNLPVINDWYNWMSTPLINFAQTGDFDNYSYERMSDMFFIPEPETILHGDGYYIYNGHYYKRTDLGIMRNILFWGIVGLIISYGVTILSFSATRKKSMAFFLMILLTFIIFEYKGDVYYEILAFALPLTSFGLIKYSIISENNK